MRSANIECPEGGKLCLIGEKLALIGHVRLDLPFNDVSGYRGYDIFDLCAY
jgi:hypothetical protein